MLVDIVLYLASIILFGFGLVLQTIGFVIPDGIEDALAYFFSSFNIYQGVFPVSTLMSAVGIYFSFLVALYSVKIALFLFGMTPWFGKKGRIPKA